MRVGRSGCCRLSLSVWRFTPRNMATTDGSLSVRNVVEPSRSYCCFSIKVFFFFFFFFWFRRAYVFCQPFFGDMNRNVALLFSPYRACVLKRMIVLLSLSLVYSFVGIRRRYGCARYQKLFLEYCSFHSFFSINTLRYLIHLQRKNWEVKFQAVVKSHHPKIINPKNQSLLFTKYFSP